MNDTITEGHFFENRFSDRHNTIGFSFLNGTTVGECHCGEVFITHTETEFAGQRALKTQWRAHAKGHK